MDLIKESDAFKRICPIRQPSGQCVGSGCMAWAEAPPTTKTVAIAWPVSIARPLPPPSSMLLDPMGTPEERAAKFKEDADLALSILVGTEHEGMTVTRAYAADFRLSKAGLSLAGPAIGSCSLIR